RRRHPPGDETAPAGTAEVEALVGGCDRTTAARRRDHAILLLLSRLGLRAGETVSMTLDDLDWNNGVE
ncbi:MAG: hypothetical protein OXN84_06425, partial [Albidovulum sp.]|nr:hypothetical protein [Albidovulum sp.]